MPYSSKIIEEISSEYRRVLKSFRELTDTLILQLGPKLTQEIAKEYMTHGICRRLKILERCIENVFTMFSPDRNNLLTRDELNDLDIFLHAFVINLYGVLDNFAWVFVLEKNLKALIGNKKNIGLFIRKTQNQLPKPIKDHVQSPRIIEWYTNYAKNYRDALAHRIPLYVPPCMLTDEDNIKRQELTNRINQCVKNNDFDSITELRTERDGLGTICNIFLHSISDKESRPVQIHPQMLSDGATIVELGELYVKHFPVGAYTPLTTDWQP